MGTTQTTTLEATAVTPSLFYGDTLSLPHVKVDDSQDALVHILAGCNVLVDSDETALLVLLNLGVPLEDAKSAISLAKVGLPRST